MNDTTSNSGTNTVLIVILLLLAVGFMVWFFTGGLTPAAQEQPGFNVDVNLPTTGTGDAGGAPVPQE